MEDLLEPAGYTALYCGPFQGDKFYIIGTQPLKDTSLYRRKELLSSLERLFHCTTICYCLYLR